MNQHCHFLTQLIFTFHNFFSLFLPKFLSLFTLWIFLFTIRLKGFGLWWPYAMCLWPYVPEFLRWAALKNALSYSIVLTYMYIRMYVYVCLDSPNLRACPCYVRACVRALTRSSARGAHAATLPAACTGHACARWQLFRENSSVKWQLPSYFATRSLGYSLLTTLDNFNAKNSLDQCEPQ